VHWAAVEEALAGLGWLPSSAELEYHRPVLPGHEPRLLVRPEPGQAWVWLLDSDGSTQQLASARLTRRADDQGCAVLRPIGRLTVQP
jgi:hypothetical protein